VDTLCLESDGVCPLRDRGGGGGGVMDLICEGLPCGDTIGEERVVDDFVDLMGEQVALTFSLCFGGVLARMEEEEEAEEEKEETEEEVL